MSDFVFSMRLQADAKNLRSEVEASIKLLGDLSRTAKGMGAASAQAAQGATGQAKATKGLGEASMQTTAAIGRQSTAAKASASANRSAATAARGTAVALRAEDQAADAAFEAVNNLSGGLARTGRAQQSAGNSARRTAAALAAEAKAAEGLGRSVTRLPGPLGRTSAANDNVAKSGRRAAAAARQQSQAVGGLSNTYKLAQRSALGFIAALSGAQVIRAADTYTRAENRLRSLGRTHGQTKEEMQSLFEVAKRSRSDFAGVVEVYARLTRATARLGLSQAKVQRLSETITKSFQVSGASASEAAAATLQLTQALASGVLQGDELRSLRENAPLVAQAIADEFGVTIGELKDLGAAGELTSERIVNALSKIDKSVDDAFSNTTATVEQSLTLLGNSVVRFIGLADDGSGASDVLATAIRDVADALDGMTTVAAPAIRVLGGLLAANVAARAFRLLARMILGTSGVAAALRVAQTRGLATAIAMTAMAVKARLASVAVRGLGRSMLLLGGPAGIAVAVGLSLWEVARANDGATIASDKHQKSVERMRQVLGALQTASGARRAELVAERQELKLNAEAELAAARAKANASRARLLAAQAEFAANGAIRRNGTRTREGHAAQSGLSDAEKGHNAATAEVARSIAAFALIQMELDAATSQAAVQVSREAKDAISDLSLQADGAERLAAARRKGGDALIRERAAQKAAAAARELGIDLSSKEGQAIQTTMLRIERANAIRAKSTRGRKAEVDKVAETLIALANERSAVRATAVQLSTMNALRRAGIDMTDLVVTSTGQLIGNYTSQAEAISKAVRALHELKAASRVQDVIEGLQAEADAMERTAVQARIVNELKRAGLLTDSLIVTSKGELIGIYGAEEQAIRDLVVAMDAAAQRKEAIREIEDAWRGIQDPLQQAIEAANRWRDHQLKAIKDVANGHDELARKIESVHADRIGKAYEEAQRRAKEAADKAKENVSESTKQMQTFMEGAANHMGSALEEFARTGELNFEGMVEAIIADMLRMMIQAQIVKPIIDAVSGGGGGGSGGGFFSSIGSALLGGFGGGTSTASAGSSTFLPASFHTGGVAGKSGGSRHPGVSIAAFNNAPRYHGGGIAGLKPGEVPAILKRGEPVSTPEQWNNMHGMIDALAGLAARPIILPPAANGNAAPAANDSGTDVVIIDQRGADAGPIQQRRRAGGGRAGKDLVELIIPAMNTAITQGRVDGAMNARFGATPQGRS